MRPTVQDIHQGLAQLASADPKFALFGASTHHYCLNPPLPEEEVILFEKRFGVRLPNEYREFVKEVGDGGAGPVYGVWSLNQIEEELCGGDKRRKLEFEPGRPFVRPSNVEEATSI